MSIVRAAVIKTLGCFRSGATLEKVARLTNKHAKVAQNSSFPEATVSAYPKGLDFGARIGSRTSRSGTTFDATSTGGRAAKRSCTPDRPDCGRQRRPPVIGVIERDGGTLLHGSILRAGWSPPCKHRKLPCRRQPGSSGACDGSTFRFRYVHGQARGGNLLGELHADAPHGDVRQRHPNILRSHG